MKMIAQNPERNIATFAMTETEVAPAGRTLWDRRNAWPLKTRKRPAALSLGISAFTQNAVRPEY
jgi:hypothetical protein